MDQMGSFGTRAGFKAVVWRGGNAGEHHLDDVQRWDEEVQERGWRRSMAGGMVSFCCTV